MKLGPKEMQLRALREARSEAKPEAKAAKVAKVKALANAVANTNSATYEHRDAESRRAYQRELMRKRRAESKQAR